MSSGRTHLYYKISLLLLSVYGPFSNRVGLPLHNILSPFIYVMDIFIVDLKCLSYPLQHSIIMSFLVFQPVLCLQPSSRYIFLPSLHHHMSLLSQPSTSNDSCDRLNSNKFFLFFTHLSIFHGNSTHPSNHLHLCSFKL